MLAISTATKQAYIGIEYKGKRFFSTVDAECKHSENIMKAIDRLLDENNIPFKEVGDIAVVVGPGSFTGIRIGVALAKGLCAGDNSHKVIPISTLDLMAQAVPDREYSCVINALSGKLFVCDYKNKKRTSEERVVLAEDYKDNGYCLAEENLNLRKIEISPELLLDYALSLKDKREEAKDLSPVYVRKSEELFKTIKK